MHFRFVREKELKSGKKLITIYYVGFCIDSSLFIVDCEGTLAQGNEVRQVINGWQHYASTSES